MLEFKPNSTRAPRAQSAFDGQQPRRLMLALVLLLVALGGVLWHDRDFWFGTEQSILDDAPDSAAATKTVAKAVPSSAIPAHATAAPVAKKKISAAQNAVQNAVQDKNSAEPASDAPAVSTTRTVLPPLDVEVVAGDKHHKLHPGSNVTTFEITNPASAASQSAGVAPATDAVDRERLAANVVPPAQSYPLLAQQMKVQGSVVLQALIGADGVIQNLKVTSGPGILASAAEQAVREWRFKPILQNGQAVESQAKITVNFTIKIADGSAKTTLAESRPLTIESLAR